MNFCLAVKVYAEFALLENFCMDFTLLYSAKIVSKNPAHIFRVVLSSVLGACFAVVFPLIKLHAWILYCIKICSGLVICATVGKFKNFKAYLKLTGVFFGFSFVLGGALIGLFSLFKIEYSLSGQAVLSSVPIGIPLFGALCIVALARKIAKRLKKVNKIHVSCDVFCGEKQVGLSGFFDSGNCVYHMGQPVSVIPLSCAAQIVDINGIKDSVKIHTVAGSKKIKVFTADRLVINDGEKVSEIKKAKIGVSNALYGDAVLHPDVMEE